MNEEIIFKRVLDCCFRLHSNLGPGLLENAYEECLYYEIRQAGLKVDKQKPLPLIYQNVILETGYRLDLLVEHRVIVEIKAVESLNGVHLAQLLTYLKLTGLHLGLLVNFNVSSLRNGIKRVIK